MDTFKSACIAILFGLTAAAIFQLIGFHGYNAGYWVGTIQMITYFNLKDWK